MASCNLMLPDEREKISETIRTKKERGTKKKKKKTFRREDEESMEIES
jgi:hypothetical protein